MEEPQIVDADIQECASAQGRFEFSLPACALRDKAVVAFHVLYVADNALVQQLPKLFVERQETGPEGLHDEEPLFLRQPVERLRLPAFRGKWLLAEHVFAGV